MQGVRMIATRSRSPVKSSGSGATGTQRERNGFAIILRTLIFDFSLRSPRAVAGSAGR